MTNSNRLLIFIICIGLASVAFGLGASLASNTNQTYDFPTYQQSVAGRSQDAERPCAPSRSIAESDLCAQWRAAAASESSAEWTKWGVIIAAIGSCLLLWQIMLTREALTDTADATKEMREANRIASIVQRPWIDISAELLSFQHPSDKAFTLEVRVSFKNIGQMVAENFHGKVDVVAMDDNWLEHQNARYSKFAKKFEERDTVVIPGQINDYVIQSSQAHKWLPWQDRHGSRECYLMVLATAAYRIPGDESWHFSMKAFSVGENQGNIHNRTLIEDSIGSLSLDQLLIQPLGRSRAS